MGIQPAEYNVVAKLLTLKEPDIPLDIPLLALEFIAPEAILAGMDVVVIVGVFSMQITALKTKSQFQNYNKDQALSLIDHHQPECHVWSSTSDVCFTFNDPSEISRANLLKCSG